MRLHGLYFDRDASIDTSGRRLSDDWSVARVGARLDWTPSAFDRVSLHSTLYAGDLGGGLQLVSQFTLPLCLQFARACQHSRGVPHGRLGA